MYYEFDFEGRHYNADIKHFDELSAEDIKQYRVTENTFLVFLNTATEQKVFELFIDAGDFSQRWKTHSDLYVDRAICSIIGNHIDAVSM